MLVVILISAAPDGAAPGTRSIGSAFDPATSAVVIGRKHVRIAPTTQAEAARPPAPHADSGLGAEFLPTFASSDFAVSPPLRVAHSRAAGDPRTLTRAHGARAPPSA